jgi:hypothetical protein
MAVPEHFLIAPIKPNRRAAVARHFIPLHSSNLFVKIHLMALWLAYIRQDDSFWNFNSALKHVCEISSNLSILQNHMDDGG